MSKLKAERSITVLDKGSDSVSPVCYTFTVPNGWEHNMDIEAIYLLFPQPADCIAYLEGLRWQGKPRCPYCKRANSTPVKTERRHHCNICNVAFSVTVGTLFHHTRLPLQKWFLTIALMMQVEKDPSVRRLAALIDVDKNTASHLARRVREARLKEFHLLRQVADTLMER
jgi:transposase-like protein